MRVIIAVLALLGVVFYLFVQDPLLLGVRHSVQGALYNVLLDDEEETDEAALVLELAHFLADEQAVWEGYRLSTKPLIITFDNGHQYAFFLSPQSTGLWQQRQQGALSYLFSERDHYGVGAIQMHGHWPVEGQAAFVFHIDQHHPKGMDPLHVLLHERFHLYQHESFSAGADPLEYMDQFNEENLALMQLEDLILGDFLTALMDEKKSHAHIEHYLYDYLAVVAQRKSLISEDSWRWELSQQTVEGLAEYVAMRQVGLVRAEKPYNAYLRLVGQLEAPMINDEILERTVKGRHYGVGATQGIALDFMGVSDWRQRVEKEGLAPLELLMQRMPLADSEIEDAVETVKGRFGYQSIRNQVARAIAAYRQEIAELMEDYQQQEGVALRLSFPPSGGIQGGGDSLELFFLADGSALSVTDTSTNVSDDGQWEVSFVRAPFVFKERDGSLRFKCPADSVISVDGREMTVRQAAERCGGAPLSFHELTLSSKPGRLRSSGHSGRLCLEEGHLCIRYDRDGK